MRQAIKTILESQAAALKSKINTIPEQKKLAYAQYERTLASLDAKKKRLKKELVSIEKLLKPKGQK